MTIFHFNCCPCGAKPREVPLGDFLREWQPDDGKRVEELAAQMHTALRQLRGGMEGRRSSYIASEVGILLDEFRAGLEVSSFPVQLNECSPWSNFKCFVASAMMAPAE